MSFPVKLPHSLTFTRHDAFVQIVDGCSSAGETLETVKKRRNLNVCSQFTRKIACSHTFQVQVTLEWVHTDEDIGHQRVTSFYI
jgi:hypothetical protein